MLTPHLCAPAEGDAFPDDIGIMRSGIYNLGFLRVRACPESESILAWWARRLQYQCISNQDAGIFVDQRFMDLVPGFAEKARILRDPTLNVAYWNLQQRTLSFEDEAWKVDGRPLGFYHFSGFDPAKMDRLSKYTDNFRGNAIWPALSRLLEQYAAELRANNHGRIPAGFMPTTALRRAHRSRRLFARCSEIVISPGRRSIRDLRILLARAYAGAMGRVVVGYRHKPDGIPAWTGALVAAHI